MRVGGRGERVGEREGSGGERVAREKGRGLSNVLYNRVHVRYTLGTR